MSLLKYKTERYFKNRYWKDSQFRIKHIKAVQAWQKLNPDKVKQYRKNANRRYHNRDKKEIERRKRYLKKLRSKKK